MQTLKFYHNCNDQNLAKRYVEINGIQRLLVCPHHFGEPGFQVWEMTGETTGLHTEYKRLKDAKKDALEIGEFVGLPVYQEKRDGTEIFLTSGK